MTDAELRDAAWAELVQTTVGYNKVANYSPEKFAATHWGKGKALLDQIGAAPPPPPVTEPLPIRGAGYKLVFEDDFDTLDTTFWRRSIWYKPEDDGSNVYVKDGVLNIMGPDRHLMTRTKAWQFGYFECRMRYTHSANAFPGFWMMSDNWMRTGDCTTLKISEYDIFEGFSGNFPRSHSGALHRNTSSKCGMPDQYNNSNSWTNDCGYDLGSNWRTYSGLWTPQTVYWYVEEKLLKQFPVWDTTNQPMRLIFQMSNHGNADPSLRTEVDWVRVWQK